MKTYNAESGRSMIEMLGVLAIIGVLSVGGIAGYSKAMTKYRINKTIEQISLVVGNFRTFFASQKNYRDLFETYSPETNYTLLKKAKLIPDEMWNNSNDGFVDAWGQTMYISKFYSTDQEFGIVINKLSQDACIELATKDWSASSPFAVSIGSVLVMSFASDKKLKYNNCESGNHSGPNGNAYVLCGQTSIPLEIATEKCLSGNNNTFSLAFH